MIPRMKIQLALLFYHFFGVLLQGGGVCMSGVHVKS